ncbi:MAG: helix-turn-helix domain-containing protein [Thermoplasmatota archaeon]|jgi:DNA-binding MarR family transcriptional regulator
MSLKIRLKRLEIPPAGNVSEDIEFICRSFGYFSQRDKQGTAGKVFQVLVEDASTDSKGLTSDEIAERLNLTRGAIVYHLNDFIEAGLVIREKNLYRLRSTSLQRSIEEIMRDSQRIFDDMMKIAHDIDRQLGNFYR